MWSNGEIQTGKTLISSIYAVHLYNDRFLHLSLIAPQSISSQCFNYGKAAFFISGSLGSNGSKTF